MNCPLLGSSWSVNDDAGIDWEPSGHVAPGYGASNAGSYASFQKDFTTPEVVQAPTQLGLPNLGDVNGPKWGHFSTVNDEAGTRYYYGTGTGYGQSGHRDQYAGPYTSFPKDLTTPKVEQAPMQLGLPNLGGMNGPKWGHFGTVNDEAGGRHGYGTTTGYGQSGYGNQYAGSYTFFPKDFTTSEVMQSPTQLQLGLLNLGGMNGPSWQNSYAGNDSPGGEGYRAGGV
jgi:hypothetical protein